MNFIQTVISLVLDYINSIPSESWLALGTLLGGSAIVTVVIAWYNRSRVRRDLAKLGKALVTFNIIFLSALITILDFVINNGTTFGVFLPYFGKHLPQVIGISTIIYNVAKPTLAWWNDRKNNKPITNNLPNLTPLVDAIGNPIPEPNMPSSSLGSASVGMEPPAANLWNR